MLEELTTQSLAPPSSRPAAPAMAENAAAAEAAPKPAVRYKTEDDVRKLLAGDNFKKFCKKKCGECHAPAFKKFLKVSPLVVRAQVGSFWCASCGRLLCDAHRNQHTCEVEDAELERRRRMNVDDIRADIKRREDAKAEADAKAAAVKRAADEKKFAIVSAWKQRRKHVAGVSTSIANMCQRWAVQADPGRAQDELLELYTSCNRINLRLWNEVQEPTIQLDIDHEAWDKLCRNYDRAKELTGLVIVVEGTPLDMHLPWLPRPPPEAEEGGAPDLGA